MSDVAIVGAPPTASGLSTGHRARRILLIVAAVVVAGVLASLFGKGAA